MTSSAAFSRSSSRNVGYVYCLSNPAMPGLVKIGFTLRTAEERSRELFTGYQGNSATGVPLPFEVVRQWQVPAEKAEEIEQQIHSILHRHRVPGHGRQRPKEFFYLSPNQAVVEVESALKQLDWWGVAQAEKFRLDAETKAREERRKAEAANQRDFEAKELQIRQEVLRKQNQWRESARLTKSGEGQTNGLKWGAIWFAGSWLILGAAGAKDAVGWLCLALGILAYYMTKDAPATAYLGSQAARDVLAQIESEVRKEMSPGPIDFFCTHCQAELVMRQPPENPTMLIRCPTCKNTFSWAGCKKK